MKDILCQATDTCTTKPSGRMGWTPVMLFIILYSTAFGEGLPPHFQYSRGAKEDRNELVNTNNISDISRAFLATQMEMELTTIKFGPHGIL